MKAESERNLPPTVLKANPIEKNNYVKSIAGIFGGVKKVSEKKIENFDGSQNAEKNSKVSQIPKPPKEKDANETKPGSVRDLAKKIYDQPKKLTNDPKHQHNHSLNLVKPGNFNADEGKNIPDEKPATEIISHQHHRSQSARKVATPNK